MKYYFLFFEFVTWKKVIYLAPIFFSRKERTDATIITMHTFMFSDDTLSFKVFILLSCSLFLSRYTPNVLYLMDYASKRKFKTMFTKIFLCVNV